MNKVLNVMLLSVAIVTVAGCSRTKDVPADTGSTVAPVSIGTTTADVSGRPGVTGAGANVATVFYFDFDQSTLKPEARDALLQHAAALKADPLNIRLEGHADERGTREYNIALGERRANAVAQFLALQGVSPTLIEVISYGEERPAALGTSESAWSLNRRVELKAN